MPEFQLTQGSPDFTNLPWGQPFESWPILSSQTIELPRGISRHPVLFINQAGVIYALKQLPNDLGCHEHKVLQRACELRLPVVSSLGVVILDQGGEVLVTRYLERSLPYRSLFMSPSLNRYREHLIGAMANLLVQLHLSGLFWGDCSLSNTLFRRDAGVLQAYLVDAESSELESSPLPPGLRHSDLSQMENNVHEDLSELAESGYLDSSTPYYDTSSLIRLRYQSLWEIITRADQVSSGSSYHTQERIRELNELGFSVRGVEIQPTDDGDRLFLRVSVTDRNYHRDQLLSLTGLQAEEMQARKMINEINELRATLSWERGNQVPMDAAAFHWLEYIFKPVMARLVPLAEQRQRHQDEANPVLNTDPAELYCQVLEHKWFLSEKVGHDVGHLTALEDYILEFGQ
jgi:hypothetical protein